MYRSKLKKALGDKDSDKVQYNLALVEGRLKALEQVNKTALTDQIRQRLDEKVRAARQEWEQTEQVLDMARGLMKLAPSTSSEGPTTHSRVQWKWTPVPFHGKKGEWSVWWQVYSTAIHNDSGLEPEWKMKALSECLKGEAADVLGNLDRTGANYAQAIGLLQSRFGDPLVLSKEYYEQLEKLPPATDLKTQRQTLDKLMAIVRNLEALQATVSIDENLVKRHICRKFPQEFLRWVMHDLERDFPDWSFKLPDLLNGLKRMMKADVYIMTQIYDETDTKQNDPKPVGVLTASNKRPNTTPTTDSANSRKKSSCIFCDGSHFSADCRRYSTIPARKQKLTELRRCHNCLIRYHEASKCRSSLAKCGRCHNNHQTALCVVAPTQQTENQNRRNRRGKLILFSDSFLQTFLCFLKSNSGKTYEIRGLFDPGSKNSFITLDVAKLLNLPLVDSIDMSCLRFADENVTYVKGYHILVTLYNSYNESRTFQMLTTPCITGDITTSPSPEETAKLLPPLIDYADYDIFQHEQRPIKILIGTDLYHSLVYVRNSYDLACGVTMLKSFFGWVPSGGVKSSEAPKTRTSATLLVGKSNPTVCTSDNLIPSDINLEFMWILEVLGIESPDKHIEKGSDYVVEFYKRTTYIDHLGRKNICIPWKETKTELPSNFRVALARLRQLIEKTPPHLLQIGDDHFKQQEKDGIIEDAPPLSKICTTKTDRKRRIHYMPHRWLVQKGKIRVVYDASAPTKSGVSLNNEIYQGANLTTNIVRLLLNFRLFKIALVADIEKAFLQISLNEADRDGTRFLWLKNINEPVTERNLSYKRFARLPMGLNVSPCILNLVLADTFNEPPINPWLIEGEKKFYADNLVTSVPAHTDALELFEAMTSRLESIKMNLRDWATNDECIASALPPEKLDKTVDKISVLGLPWTRSNDMLTIKLDEVTSLECTKRNVLKFYASIFDPLGLIAPCVLELKLFIQKCWKQAYEWNTKLPPNLEAEWLKLRTDALKIPDISISRHYFDNSETGVYDLHVFCDASQKAYACCAYLCYKDKRTLQTFSRLIFSKIRVAPPKHMTIPKLELMAVVIGTRVTLFLRQNLTISITKSFLWTDATTILQWLDSKEILPPFVQNRINEIRRATDITFRFVNTSDNPADCASRGQTVYLLKHNTLWWNGPKWLSHEKLWLKLPLNVQTVTLLTTMHEAVNFLSTHLENNIKTWSGRIRVFYFVIKACFLCSKQPFYATDTEATIVAERLLVKELQLKYFYKEIEQLKKGGRPRSNLDLFLDDKGIIRCRGRLHYARFPWETKHPILLPRESPATFSLIKEIHETNKHIGTSHTLAKLRELYWITKGRAKVKSVIHSCYKCRYWFGGSYPLPPIPPLPESRVADVIPFLQIGIDAFRPLHILNSNNDIIDVQVLIFTCLVTRAIHLELVPNLTGDQFLMALERFCCLKRVPKLIISDNAKTFVFIQPLVGIKVQIRDHKINHLLTSNRIEWYFIPQYAPWFGGAYERLIQIIKKCLKISYGKVYLTYIELQTVLYKIADILNGRPLTYVSADEVVEPLTPNHFVKLGPTNINVSLEPYAKPPLSTTGSNLMRKWNVLTRILDGYWDAFKNLYLLSLRERHMTHHKEKKGTAKFQPRVGDVVLIQENSMPRAYWKLGTIEKLDVRQAVAYVRHKKDLLIRSIRHLYPLEVQRDKPVFT